MKMAAALALAGIAKLPVPESVKIAIPGREFVFGREYVIPTPFDPRLITTLPVAVAKAAWESGTAKIEIKDYKAYALELTARVNE